MHNKNPMMMQRPANAIIPGRVHIAFLNNSPVNVGSQKGQRPCVLLRRFGQDGTQIYKGIPFVLGFGEAITMYGYRIYGETTNITITQIGIGNIVLGSDTIKFLPTTKVSQIMNCCIQQFTLVCKYTRNLGVISEKWQQHVRWLDFQY